MSMKLVKPGSAPERATRTTVDTIEITQKVVASWKAPPFQRELSVTPRVLEVATQITANGGVLPGILTIGILDGDTYLVDGQHRIAAWGTTGLDVGYADVRLHWFDTMADMAEEFVRLNSSLVRLRPDDILRGLEPKMSALTRIRKKCPFIGYDNVRRDHEAAVLSMSVFVRMWATSRKEVPQLSGSSVQALQTFDDSEVVGAMDFATVCYEAWHRDRAHARLWGALNLTLCAWLYRRLVLGEKTPYSQAAQMSREDFKKCLMALAADRDYSDYLTNRQMRERDRAPSYARAKRIFQHRMFVEHGTKMRLPQPAWSHQ